MQLIQYVTVVLCLGVEGLQFRLNLMAKTFKSRAKYNTKVCDNLSNATQLQLLQWYKSLTEQDLGLMEDKVLYFSGGGISAFFTS